MALSRERLACGRNEVVLQTPDDTQLDSLVLRDIEDVEWGAPGGTLTSERKEDQRKNVPSFNLGEDPLVLGIVISHQFAVLHREALAPERQVSNGRFHIGLWVAFIPSQWGKHLKGTLNTPCSASGSGTYALSTSSLPRVCPPPMNLVLAAGAGAGGPALLAETQAAEGWR